MSLATPMLVGKRVLLVEDEALVAMLIEDVLVECGCSILGPCGTVDATLEVVRTETFDLAVLDVNLRGIKVYPVAELLTERRIPFLFLSGYGDEAVPVGRSTWKVCAKPFKARDLVEALNGALIPEVH